MHYYNRHIGDYARETGHLSAEEHGALTLLIDRYYLKEEPIADDQAHRIAKVSREVVEPLLAEFFVREGSVWRNVEADKAIAKYQANAEVNRRNGKLSKGRPRKVKPEEKPGETHPDTGSDTHSGGESGGEQKPAENPNQEPITINQEKIPPTPQTGEAAAPPAKKRKPRARVPGTENYSASFLRFWDAYPNGKRSKKDDAHEVWKRDGLADFVDTIIEDVENRKAEHWGWIKDGGSYIPGAQVYLNQHRWNDDIEPIPAGAGNRRASVEQNNDRVADQWAGRNGGVLE